MKQHKVIIDDFGTATWFYRGKIHRENGPAVEQTDGTKIYYSHGQIHRDDGPAFITGGGDKYWYVNGVRHREDGPAVVTRYEQKSYYLNGFFLTAFDFLQKTTKNGAVLNISGKLYRLNLLGSTDQPGMDDFTKPKRRVKTKAL